MDIENLKKEYAELTEKLADPEIISRWEEFQEISKRRSHLDKIIKKQEEITALQKQLEENNQILSANEDDELSVIAQQELQTIHESIRTAEKELERFLKQQHEDSPTGIVMEIRSGAGGDEASLFARNLYDMYTKYAASQGWKQTLVDISDTDIRGLREVSFMIEGEDVFEKLRHEGGVHRVQRIPETEKAGRIHTSTASIAVLPKPNKTKIDINPSELEIEAYNASGPGGQNVNKRKTAIRVLHKPTGLIVTSQASRNQQQNREFAIQLLQLKLNQQKQEQEESLLSSERRSQIGGAMRAEKIRTYNFPQDRVTDHRVQQSWHGIEKIMQGDIDDITSALESIKE